jgi:indolepyruvate ferredoxin oxidoreductase
MGDSIATNPFLLGFAVQKGLLPLSAASILQAIEDHGVAVAQNRLAFNWGRRAAHDLAATVQAAGLDNESKAEEPLSARPLDAMIKALAAELRNYQNEAFSARFLARVADVAAAERRVDLTSEKLARAYALGLYKLMAAKDEYEVARLYARPEFLQKLRATFEGDFTLSFYFAPPILAASGAHAPRKRRFGAWALPGLRLLAALRFLRGSWFDPFRFSPDRKLERELLRDYEQMMRDVAARLSADNLDVAAELAALPQRMRGYGPVKARYVAQARKQQAFLKKSFDAAEAKRQPSLPSASGELDDAPSGASQPDGRSRVITETEGRKS